MLSLPGSEALGDRLAAVLSMERGTTATRRFPDGESYVRIASPVRDRDVVVTEDSSITGRLTATSVRVLTHQFRVVYARPQTLIPPETFEVTAASPAFTAYGGVARGQPK